MLQKLDHSLTQIIGLTAPANCSSLTSVMLDRTDGLDWRGVMTRFVRDIREIMEKWEVERVTAMEDLPAAANSR